MYLDWEKTNTDLFYNTHNPGSPIQAFAWIPNRCICMKTSRQNALGHFFKCQDTLKSAIELTLISPLQLIFHSVF